MCTEHWRAYRKGPREARVAARAGEEGTAAGPAAEEADAAKHHRSPFGGPLGANSGPLCIQAASGLSPTVAPKEVISDVLATLPLAISDRALGLRHGVLPLTVIANAVALAGLMAWEPARWKSAP